MFRYCLIACLSLLAAGADVISSVSQLKPGDHLYYWSGVWAKLPEQIGFQHHAIYLGAGTVAHWHPVKSDKMMEGPVTVVTYQRFAKGAVQGGRDIYRVPYGVGKCRYVTSFGGTCVPEFHDPAAVAVIRAFSTLFDRFQVGLYTTCETHATWVKTGQSSMSRQVTPVSGLMKLGTVVSNVVWKALFKRGLHKEEEIPASELPTILRRSLAEVGVSIPEGVWRKIDGDAEAAIRLCKIITFRLHVSPRPAQIPPRRAASRVETSRRLAFALSFLADGENLLGALEGYPLPELVDYLRGDVPTSADAWRALPRTFKSLAAADDDSDGSSDIEGPGALASVVVDAPAEPEVSVAGARPSVAGPPSTVA